MERENNNLHCGACMTYFDNVEDLNFHIESCCAAKVMLPYIHLCWYGEVDQVGHPLSHLLQCLFRNADLIKFYIYSIVSEMNTFDRSKIHSSLCDKLCLDYNKFRPFESSDIKEIPTKKGAEKILWDAIREEILDILSKAKVY